MLSSVDATFVGGLLPLRPEFGVRDNVAHIEILNDSRIVGTLSVPLRIGTHVATLDLAAAPEREAETRCAPASAAHFKGAFRGMRPRSRRLRHSCQLVRTGVLCRKASS
jgi:hypothetical protein